MKRTVRFNWYIWLYPILFFLIASVGFNDSGGTDYDRQVYYLQLYENEDLSFMFEKLLNNEEKVFFHIIYIVLHRAIGITPRPYIALNTFVYFSLIVFLISKYVRNDNQKNMTYLTNKNLSNLCVFTFLSLCPVLFAICRNFCAITFVYIGLLLILNRKFIFALIPFVIAYLTHEGILLIFFILIIGWGCYYLWIRKSKMRNIRNLIIILVSVFLLIFGSSYFSSITSLFFNTGLLSEHYMDTYGAQASGDGAYKMVVVLSMLGPLICLFVNCLMDRRNNLIYGISVAGLFVICLLFNQKIFLVQRIMIFMPIFIGLTSYQICSDFIQKKGAIPISYYILMLLVPVNVLFQFIIQFHLFFGDF